MFSIFFFSAGEGIGRRGSRTRIFFFSYLFFLFFTYFLYFFFSQEKASADAALERAYLQIESLKESMAARKSRHAAEVFT